MLAMFSDGCVTSLNMPCSFGQSERSIESRRVVGIVTTQFIVHVIVSSHERHGFIQRCV